MEELRQDEDGGRECGRVGNSLALLSDTLSSIRTLNKDP